MLAGLGPAVCEEEEAAPSSGDMEQCVTVERELDKVLQKFSGYGQHCERSLEELIDYTGGLRREIMQASGKRGPGVY